MRIPVAVYLTLLLALPGCAREEPAAPTPVVAAVASTPVAARPQPSPETPNSRHAPDRRLPPIGGTQSLPPSDLPLILPAPAKAAAGLPPALQALRASATTSNTAAGWRRLADAAAGQRYFAEAADAYRREAAVYRRTGDGNAAQIEELKGAQYATQLDVYVQRLAMPWDHARFDTHARLEPGLGCYVGAFIDRDDEIRHLSFDNQTFGDIVQFGERVAKRHASHFMYRRYGQPFPRQWAEYCKRLGVIPHIAWEPDSLAAVRDDPYLRGWVEQVKALDWPVFIRFAGEMNGDWTPYHGDPAAYRATFRRVYQAFRAAPRAALIWCPNTIPENGLDAYYPGDDACDWVGVNFYSVLYLDNDPKRPGDKIHPTDLLDHVYRRYSSRKPIAIAEYAATHEAKVDPRPRPDFATDKIAQLYSSLPTRYPRVKMVDWYDCNNIRHASPGRQLNNYLLTDVPEILDAYRAAVAHSWFLGADDVRRHEEAHEVVLPLRDGERLQAAGALQAWIRTYVPRPRVYFRLDGRIVYATSHPDRYRFPIGGLAAGHHVFEVLVYDDTSKFVAATRRAFEL